MDISTFCPRTGLGCRGAGGAAAFWLLRQTQMKKNSKAMASGMATLGTSMYRISILFFSLESFESGGRSRNKKEKEQKSREFKYRGYYYTAPFKRTSHSFIHTSPL